MLFWKPFSEIEQWQRELNISSGCQILTTTLCLCHDSCHRSGSSWRRRMWRVLTRKLTSFTCKKTNPNATHSPSKSTFCQRLSAGFRQCTFLPPGGRNVSPWESALYLSLPAPVWEETESSDHRVGHEVNYTCFTVKWSGVHAGVCSESSTSCRKTMKVLV